jgi:pimeloyl-ACP methyl ester carboxylesterase
MESNPAYTKPEELTILTKVLEIAYEQRGPHNGYPIILLHGFPDDVRGWDTVAVMLAEAGHCVLVPYLRGFGPTRFLDAATPRVGQQAAIGQDVLDFMDALGLTRAVLAGYDWGCRAACVASILQPVRVRALLAIHGYGVNDTISPPQPAPPIEERECWYHWYFNIERGRIGLNINRRDICRLLWQSWSPNWSFDDETFERTAHSFDNPDFVPVVIQEYRHSHGNTPGDPSFAALERHLARRPPIEVPSMVLHGADDTVHPLYRSQSHMRLFPKGTERRVVPDSGHFVPRERPIAVTEAIGQLLVKTS